MSRVIPPVTLDLKPWAENMRRYLGRALDQLGFKDASASASENGIMLWDDEAGYPVVSVNGAWQRVGASVVGSVEDGIATLDFGASSKTATVVITGVSEITAASVMLVKMRVEATDDHAAEDLLVDPIRVEIFAIVPGVGFTIYGTMQNAPANGKYNVQWALV
jgi:hypothetical protein